MILSGLEICRARQANELVLEPFDVRHVNPNSYNYHLAPELVCFSKQEPVGVRATIGNDGLILHPGRLYLGSTVELIGSNTYAITLLGRSSIGRLGIFLTATADLGHIGSLSRWTLEISVVQPVRVYPNMRIGQLSFWTVDGAGAQYAGRYLGDLTAEPCKDQSLIKPLLEAALDSVG